MASDLEDFHALLACGESALEDILLSPSLQTAVKAEDQELFTFLSNDEILLRLADYALTSHQSESPKYMELSIAAVSVFLSTTLYIFEAALDSNALADFLHDFLSTDESLDPRHCGHFGRIMEAQIRWGTPLLFTKYDDVVSLILNRLDILGIREFLVLLLLTSGDDIIDARHTVLQLSAIANSDDESRKMDACHCLIETFNSLTPDNEVFGYFCDSTVISNIVDAALSTTRAPVVVDLLGIVGKICAFDPELVTLSDTQRERLELRPGHIDLWSSSALGITRPDCVELFKLFFEPEAHQFLHENMIRVFDEQDRENLMKVAAIPDFLNNIVDAYGTPQWCPHLFRVSVMFSSADLTCLVPRKRKWKRFLSREFMRAVHVMNSDYGGRMPTAYDDSEPDSDGDDEFAQIPDVQAEYVECEEEEEEEFVEEEELQGYQQEMACIEDDEDEDDGGEVDIVV